MSIQQLSRLLPLPDEELKQVLDYAGTLSKQDAVDHFQNLLGDSPEASAFVASFNSRRRGPGGSSSTANSASQSRSQSQSRPQKPSRASDIDAVPKSTRNREKKKKADIHVPQARKINSTGPAPGTAYKKDDETFEYISKSNSKKLGVPSASASASASASRSSSVGPAASAQAEPSKATFDVQSFMLDTAGPASAPAPAPKKQKQAASAGHLVGDNLQPKKKTKSAATKVNITGGLPMTGASAAVTDLDAAIRALEISTNPTHKSHSKTRKCNCVATRHPLQSAAPNCTKCGKVICIKEGLGPCTFCGTPLLKPDELQAILKELSAERGRERMAVDREAHKRADIAAAPSSYAQARSGPLSDALLLARQHKDRLLAFQAQNAQRTRVVDEAADFDVGMAQGHLGGSMWSTPLERALELKRQQKILREMEWNARPEYEKRRQVVSIDVVGRKVVKTMAAVERPATPESEDDGDGEVDDEYGVLEAIGGSSSSSGGGGKFSKNPLLGGLIRPVFTPSKGKDAEKPRERGAHRWRRVQDDRDDNEAVILDGGVYGHGSSGGAETADEPAVCG